jgi:hypothetical protein
MDGLCLIRCDNRQRLTPNELSNFVVAAKAATYKAEATHTAASFFGKLF